MFDEPQASSDPRINLDYKNFTGGSAREDAFEKSVLPRIIYLLSFIYVLALFWIIFAVSSRDF